MSGSRSSGLRNWKGSPGGMRDTLLKVVGVWPLLLWASSTPIRIMAGGVNMPVSEAPGPYQLEWLRRDPHPHPAQSSTSSLEPARLEPGWLSRKRAPSCLLSSPVSS